MNLVSFSDLDGVPISYARLPDHPYGTKGKYPRTVRLDKTFHDQLLICLEDLWATCPWGKPEVLVSGGCYVEKAGRHGEGRAIDIDAIWWKDYRVITHDAKQVPVAYLGIEAVLRKHLGMVLDFWYNHAHEDHWHCDDGTPLGWRGSRNQSVFMQAALTHVHGYHVDIDGVVGKETREALALVQGAAYHEDISQTWASFLSLTAASAFSQV